MGYPMTYQRLVRRNHLEGDYTLVVANEHEHAHKIIGTISGDMRRLEKDQRDIHNLKKYAEAAGITTEQAEIVLTLFFEDKL